MPFLGTGCAKPRVELAVASQPNVNPDNSGRPSPVIVKVLELRNDVAFKQAEFQTLFNTPLQILGADLLAADELTFIPGEARRVAYQPTPNTKFVGVIAGFRQMDRALWRIIKPVDPKKGNWLSFELNDVTILVVPDKDAKGWDPEKAVQQYQQQLAGAQTRNTPGAASDAKQPGTMTPTGPQQTQPPAPTTKAQSAPTGINSALDNTTGKAGTRAEQGAKEAITVINQNGVETLPNGQAVVPPPASPPLSTPNLPTQILPAMRSL